MVSYLTYSAEDDHTVVLSAFATALLLGRPEPQRY